MDEMVYHTRGNFAKTIWLRFGCKSRPRGGASADRRIANENQWAALCRAAATFARNNFAFNRAAGNLSAMLSQEEIQNALKSVKYPGYSRDIVSFGLVKEISVANGAVSVTMQLTSPNPEAAQQIKIESERVLKSLPGVNHVHVEVRQPAAGNQRPPVRSRTRTKSPALKELLPSPAAKAALANPPVP
jgi:metal-sulfur cluster biosynthetic enzyme